MHGQFFEDHTGCEAAQYIHAKYSFDLSEVQFDVPAPEIEFFQLMGRIKLRIEQRGRENDLLGAKPRDGDFKSETSDENRGRMKRFSARSGMGKRVVPQLR
jgi:hypothetical protein